MMRAMRYSLDEIETFLTVMELGTISAAAARLNLSKSVISKRVSDFEATVEGRPVTVRVPWSKPLTERPEIRLEVVRMYTEACAILGVTPRGAQEH